MLLSRTRADCSSRLRSIAGVPNRNVSLSMPHRRTSSSRFLEKFGPAPRNAIEEQIREAWTESPFRLSISGFAESPLDVGYVSWVLRSARSNDDSSRL